MYVTKWCVLKVDSCHKLLGTYKNYCDFSYIPIFPGSITACSNWTERVFVVAEAQAQQNHFFIRIKAEVLGARYTLPWRTFSKQK